MAQIGVGINENVVISKAFMNEKKRLVIELAPAPIPGTAKKSIFDSLTTAGVQNDSNANFQLSLLGPLLPKKEDQTPDKKIELLTGDLQRLRNQQTQILEQFMLSEAVDLDKIEVQFANTGISDGPTYEAKILDQDILNRIYENLSERFIELIKPFLDNPEFAVRFKLCRQSKDKHYATIPSRFLSDQPFIELMTVPLEQTRVKFTKWEKDQGYDDGTPVKAGDKAEAKAGAPASNGVLAVSDANPFAPQV